MNPFEKLELVILEGENPAKNIRLTVYFIHGETDMLPKDICGHNSNYHSNGIQLPLSFSKTIELPGLTINLLRLPYFGAYIHPVPSSV